MDGLVDIPSQVRKPGFGDDWLQSVDRPRGRGMFTTTTPITRITDTSPCLYFSILLPDAPSIGQHLRSCDSRHHTILKKTRPQVDE